MRHVTTESRRADPAAKQADWITQRVGIREFRAQIPGKHRCYIWP